MYYTISSQRKNKIAVCIYLYHTDLWNEFEYLLKPIKDLVRLYIGLPYNSDFCIKQFEYFDHSIEYYHNYGADVAPFIDQLSHINESIFLKLHSKKSFWGFKFHINWRHLILNDLLGSVDQFIDNIQILSNVNNGILSSKPLLMKNRELTNKKHIEHICSLIDIDYREVKNSQFVAGNMFFGRTELYQQILSPKKNKIDKLLQEDKGKIDDTFHGTYSHAMERIFGYIVTANNKKFAHPNYKTIKIMNNKAPNKLYFNMVKMFNDNCYLLEDANVYGKIISESNKHMLIEWHHMPNIIQQMYHKPEPNTLIKI